MKKLEDNKELRRFEMEVDGRIAFLDYSESGGKVYLNRLFVPTELRGGGVAAELASLVLAHLEDRGEEYVPVCSYVVRYVERRKK